MSERLAFLAAIREAPADDVPRLVFADWLDEQDDDCDRATAEFVRVSCAMNANKTRQTRPEGRFLHENWPRLVPKLAAAGYHLNRRSGHTVTLIKEEYVPALVTPDEGHAAYKYNRWCHVTFWRGFATAISTYQHRDLAAVALAARTQPLAFLFIQEGVTGENDRWAEISSRAFQHPARSIAPNDVFDRIVGHDVLVGDGSNYDNAPNQMLVKRFNRTGCVPRAEKALSDAIRSWIDATPPPA